VNEGGGRGEAETVRIGRQLVALELMRRGVRVRGSRDDCAREASVEEVTQARVSATLKCSAPPLSGENWPRSLQPFTF
jgi:hypothetical protein